MIKEKYIQSFYLFPSFESFMCENWQLLQNRSFYKWVAISRKVDLDFFWLITYFFKKL